MARQPRQLARQGTADLLTRAAVLAYAGPNGEVISDGETLRLQNGATPGGIPLARSGRKAVANQNYVGGSGDAYIGMTTLTAARTITLPSAANFAPGQALYVADESGACSGTLTITVAAAGSDTIAGQPSVQLATPYQKLTFHSNGSNLWTYA